MDLFKQYPELPSYLDDTDKYEVSAAEFRADDQRWLIVTQRGPIDGGQFLFKITKDGLQPGSVETAINLNPASRGLEFQRDVGPAYQEASAQDHSAVTSKMQEDVNVYSTASGPDGGNLACVWAVRHVVNQALNRWITLTDSTSVFAAELQNGYKHTFDEGDVPAGGIIISPTQWTSGNMQGRHGHVGLLGPRKPGEERLIYSNSSGHAEWEQNFTLSSWKARYVGKGLSVLFYPIPSTVAVTRDAEAAAVASSESEGEGPQPDPLAGEGIPARQALVFEPDVTRDEASLPINHAQAQRVAHFMKTNFGPAISAAVAGTTFSVDLLCGIACQETAIFWVGLIDSLPVSKIVERCVFDASGDFPGTSRSAFPTDTAAFRARYGEDFTNMLIDEANQTRALRNYSPRQWVYKGYGIFQYDLQYVISDEAFFRERQWYSFDNCLSKAVGELKKKYAATGDLWHAVRAYNGSGPKATQYANNVMQFTEWCATVAS